jgi:hypothetical protein
VSAPPHYTAFRLLLAAVVVALVVAAVRVVLDPPVRAALLGFLGLT